jgi:rubrerythrin
MTAFIKDEKYPYHLGVMKNLDDIRQNGVDAWLQTQDARWRCPECETKFAWQDETCKNCDSPVPNYKADL